MYSARRTAGRCSCCAMGVKIAARAVMRAASHRFSMSGVCIIICAADDLFVWQWMTSQVKPASHVGIYVMSPTIFSPGAAAVKSRCARWDACSCRRSVRLAAGRLAGHQARSCMRERTSSGPAGRPRPRGPHGPPDPYVSRSHRMILTYKARVPRLFAVAIPARSAIRRTRNGIPPSTGTSRRPTAHAAHPIPGNRILRVDELEFLGHRWSRAKYAAAFFRNSFSIFSSRVSRSSCAAARAHSRSGGSSPACSRR